MHNTCRCCCNQSHCNEGGWSLMMSVGLFCGFRWLLIDFQPMLSPPGSTLEWTVFSFARIYIGCDRLNCSRKTWSWFWDFNDLFVFEDFCIYMNRKDCVWRLIYLTLIRANTALGSTTNRFMQKMNNFYHIFIWKIFFFDFLISGDLNLYL